MTPKKSPLATKPASVTLYRNGLTVEVKEVKAEDAGLVARALLDLMRDLVQAGYEELVPDLGGIHGGVLGEADEGDYEQGRKRKRIGF